MKKLHVLSDYEHCYKISQRWQSGALGDLLETQGMLEVMAKHSFTISYEYAERPDKVSIYFTSEENSYGALISPSKEPFRFMNGQVQEIQQRVKQIESEIIDITITQVRSLLHTEDSQP